MRSYSNADMAPAFLAFLIAIGSIVCGTSTGTRISKDHQIVHLLSIFYNNHLTVSTNTSATDKNHRDVITAKLPGSERNEWRLVPATTDPSHFEIIHHQTNEPLCALRDDLAFDGDRRTVVTWIPGPSSMRCYWEIKLHARGHYLISSVEYGEYMYAAEGGNESVWTWRKHEQPREKSYHWDIVNINNCVARDSGGDIKEF